jgi:hypothetical protein
VGQEELDVASRLEALMGGRDLKPPFDDDTVQSLSEIVDPAAEIRFMDPGGAFGRTEVPLRGLEGLRAGWREWLQPWEAFRVEFEQPIDASGGTVLTPVKLNGRLQGGMEISQPGAYLARVQDGRFVAMHFYLDRDLARSDAGLG